MDQQEVKVKILGEKIEEKKEVKKDIKEYTEKVYCKNVVYDKTQDETSQNLEKLLGSFGFDCHVEA